MKEHYRKYSLTQVNEILNASQDNPGSSQDTSRDNWSGTKTYQDAVTLATKGDHEALTKIDKKAQKLQAYVERKTQGKKLRRIHDVTGGSVNMDRFLEGRPENMIDFKRKSISNKVVDIIVNASASAFIGSETLRKRGSVIYTVIRALELQGYSVALRVVMAVQNYNKEKITFDVTLKQSNEYLDPAVAAFWIGHPSALRRGFFRIAEEEDQKIRNSFQFSVDGSYSSPRELKESLRNNAIYFKQTNGDHESMTPEKILEKEIVPQLKEQGINVNL